MAEQKYQNITESTYARWEYIGTLLAAIMIISLPIMVGFGAYGLFVLGSVPSQWFYLYALVTALAAVWSFGVETLEAIANYRAGE